MMANSIPHSLFKHPSHDVQAGTAYSGQKAQIKDSTHTDPRDSSDPSKNDRTVTKEFSRREFPSTQNSSQLDTLTTQKEAIEGRVASDNGFKDIFRHLVSNEITTPQQQHPGEKFSDARQHLLQRSHHQDPWASQKNTSEIHHTTTLKNQKTDIASTTTVKKNETHSLPQPKKEVTAAKFESKSEVMSHKSSQREHTEATSSHRPSQSLKNQSETSSFKQRSTQQDPDTSSDAAREESPSHVISKVKSLIPKEGDIQATSYEDIDDSLIDGAEVHLSSILFNPFLNGIQNQPPTRDSKIHSALNVNMIENNGHDDLTVTYETQEARDVISLIHQSSRAPNHTDFPQISSFLKTSQHNDFERSDAILKTNDTSSSSSPLPTHDMLAMSSIDTSSLTMLMGRTDQTHNKSNISLVIDQQDMIEHVSTDISQEKVSLHTFDFVDDEVLKQPQTSQNSVSELYYEETQQKNTFPNPLVNSVKGASSQQSNEDETATLTGISKIATKENASTVRDISQNGDSLDVHAQQSVQNNIENGDPQRPLSEVSNTIVHGAKTTHTFGATETKNHISSLRDVYMQVAQDFRDALQLRQSSFDIQLKPEGLGTVHLHIQFDKKTVEATFQVEQHALPLFLQNRDQIAEIFSSQGFNADQNGLTFSLNQGQQHNHQRDPHTQNTSNFSATHIDSQSNLTSKESAYPRQTLSPSPDRSNTQGTFVIHV